MSFLFYFLQLLPNFFFILFFLAYSRNFLFSCKLGRIFFYIVKVTQILEKGRFKINFLEFLNLPTSKSLK